MKKLNFEWRARVATGFVDVLGCTGIRAVKSSKSLGRGQRQNGGNFDCQSAASKLCFGLVSGGFHLLLSLRTL